MLWHVGESTADAVTSGLQSYVDTLRESRRNLIAREALLPNLSRATPAKRYTVAGA